jgi:hypothetical protein
MEISKGGGRIGDPLNIIYKGGIKCSDKKIHQICNHTTFMDMYDSRPNYLLYI